MSIDKIQQIANSLVKSVEDSEKLPVPVLSVKVAKYLKLYPEDKTLGAMSRVIENLNDNKTLFIRRSEFKSLYNKLYSTNTKFAQLFSDELGNLAKLATPVIMEKDDSISSNPYEIGDQVLASALNSAFDKNAPLKMYSQVLADKAKKTVASNLKFLNINPSFIDVVDGNEKFIILKADYETPKGLTSIFVPVEIHNGKTLEASVFVGNSGPQDLNKDNVVKYVTAKAGNKLEINGSTILNALSLASSENREISAAEIALIKVNSKKQQQSEFFQNQVIGQKVSTASVKDVELPKSEHFESFERKFASPYGVATLKFGDNNIKIARENIARELISYGYKNPQITITNVDKDAVFYGVSLDTGKTAFIVPVKISNNKVNKPSYILCNGSIALFNEEGIRDLYNQSKADYKVAAAASSLFGLKSSELIDSIRNSVDEKNYSKAEEALNVLASLNDEKAYATGFKVYTSGLSGDVKHNDVTQHPLYNPNDFYKSASSKMLVSKQTGLPINKIYIDDHGNHRPLYRRAMSETYEGASFMNHKIFG